MQKLIIIIFKGIRFLKDKTVYFFDNFVTHFIFYTQGVKYSNFDNHGWPKINISLGGSCIIGKGFRSNNRELSNPIGRFHRCSIVVGPKGQLILGSNVGMSSAAIVCHNSIRIGDNVNLGGNVVIYDTDFHSLNHKDRLQRQTDNLGTRTRPVVIGNNVFIGAHATILKGVTIGDNAVIGACSVVTKDIPANEIWAGNPVGFLKRLDV